jgi:hypothetical protein
METIFARFNLVFLIRLFAPTQYQGTTSTIAMSLELQRLRLQTILSDFGDVETSMGDQIVRRNVSLLNLLLEVARQTLFQQLM